MHTFLDPLKRARISSPTRTAVVDGDIRLSYAELWTRCRRLAGALKTAGMQFGDRIAILSANSRQYFRPRGCVLDHRTSSGGMISRPFAAAPLA